VRLLAKAAARGGNLLLNIGPMGDGRFDPKDVAILDGIASWMKTNAESIHGTTRTPLAVQAWGQTTVKDRRLYLHVCDWPADGRLRVAGLASEVLHATLLAAPQTRIEIERVGPLDVDLRVPGPAPDPWDAVIALDCADRVHGDTSRLVAPSQPTTLH